MNKLFTLLYFILLSTTFCLAKGKLIKPDHEKLNYIGRFEFTNPLEPKCSFTNSSVEAKFFGTYLSVSFTDYGAGGEQHTNYIEVILDKRPYKTIKLKPGTNDYLISDKLPINFHEVRFVKRTEASVGKIGFNGMRIQEKKLFDLKRKNVKIMVVGSTWSTGYGNELMLWSNYQTGFHAKNQDGSFTWGSILGSFYNAEVHNISYSGAGVFRGETGDTNNTMLDNIDRIHPGDTSLTWDHNQYDPDIIFVYLGSEDFLPELNKPINKLDSTSYVKSYLKIISKLNEQYPKSFILCICGGSKSNYYPFGLKQLTRWKNYTKAVVSIMGFLEKPVFYKHISGARKPWGEDWNPTRIIHRRIAYELRGYFPLILSKK